MRACIATLTISAINIVCLFPAGCVDREQHQLTQVQIAPNLHPNTSSSKHHQSEQQQEQQRNNHTPHLYVAADSEGAQTKLSAKQQQQQQQHKRKREHDPVVHPSPLNAVAAGVESYKHQKTEKRSTATTSED